MPIGKITTGVITDSAVTEAKLGAGTSSGTPVTQWHVDNLTFNSNQLSTSGTQDLILFPDTAQVGINTSSPGATLDVNGTLQAGSMKIDNTTLSTVNTNENLVISPNGSGNVEVTSVLQVDTITSNDSSAVSIQSPTQIDSTLQVAGVINANGDILLQTDGTIGTTDDGTFIRFDESSSTYTGKDLTLGSKQSVHILIDTNNDDSGNTGGFTIRGGADTVDLSNEIFKVDESGNTTASGELNAQSIRDTVNTLTPAASVALDPTAGGIQTITLGQATTFTLSNWASGHRMTLMIDDGTNYAVTWPTMQWAGGVAPTLATSGYNTIELWYVGSTLYGAYVGAHS
jgi:hypothetical protein